MMNTFWDDIWHQKATIYQLVLHIVTKSQTAIILWCFQQNLNNIIIQKGCMTVDLFSWFCDKMLAYISGFTHCRKIYNSLSLNITWPVHLKGRVNWLQLPETTNAFVYLHGLQELTFLFHINTKECHHLWLVPPPILALLHYFVHLIGCIFKSQWLYICWTTIFLTVTQTLCQQT